VTLGITYSPLFDAAGELANIIANIRDITHFREAEEMKSTFISVISHELKTPIGMSQMAFELFDSAIRKWNMAQMKRSRQILQSNISRLGKDVENILSLFTLKSAEGLRRRGGRSSMRRVTAEVHEKLHFLLEHKNLSFGSAIACDADHIAMPPRNLRTVLLNIIDNAVKFTEKGGITVSARKRGAMVQISVADTGAGIVARDRPELFEKFFKGHASIAGSGLGLVICRDIVTAYGGTIDVQSKGEGRGTRIVITVPAAAHRRKKKK